MPHVLQGKTTLKQDSYYNYKIPYIFNKYLVVFCFNLMVWAAWEKIIILHHIKRCDNKIWTTSHTKRDDYTLQYKTIYANNTLCCYELYKILYNYLNLILNLLWSFHVIFIYFTKIHMKPDDILRCFCIYKYWATLIPGKISWDSINAQVSWLFGANSFMHFSNQSHYKD